MNTNREGRNTSAETINKSELEIESVLRPAFLQEFIGQNKVVDNLLIFIEAARLRGESLDHTLLTGPPGLGKQLLVILLQEK